MERFIGKTAVVTGASSGNGEAISKKLVELGINVVGLARRIDRLEKLKKEVSQHSGKFYPLQCDLTDETQLESAFKWIFENLSPVHILINNAAVFKRTFLLDATYEQMSYSFNLNVIAPVLVTKLVYKNMVENSVQGHVINLIGIVGHTVIDVPPNIYHVCSATKHALRVITEGLRREMITNDKKIKVTDLSPSYELTEMTEGLNLPSKYDGKALQPKEVAEICSSILDTPFYFNPKACHITENHLEYE